jgi:hypothetical protein
MYGSIVYLTIELRDFDDKKLILLNVAFCLILFLFVLYECFGFFYYAGGDKLDQNENIRCSDITAFCCQCAK